MNTESAYRYAVYYMPALHSAWWGAGSQWLGRCAATGQTLPQPHIDGLSSALFEQLTQEPRRYGWHATLKAPFELQSGESLSSLRAALQALASDLRAFDLPALQVSTEGGFLALRPITSHSKIQDTAAACVTRLHALAKPLGKAELARRRQATLTPAQDRLLQQWGYPWVLDEYKFHLSLTGPLQALRPHERHALVQAAHTQFDSLPAARFAHLALFVEPQKGADFQWIESVELSA